MLVRRSLFAFALAAASTAVVSSHAAPKAGEDAKYKEKLVDAVEAYGHYYYRDFIVEDLFTYYLSESCWKRQVDEKDGYGPKNASNFADYVAEWIKNEGVANLSAIETANNSDREVNKPKVKAKVESFKGKYSFVLDASRVTCDDQISKTIYKYVQTIGEYIGSKQNKWSPKTWTIKLVIDSKAKDISVATAVDKEMRTITITAPTTEPDYEWSKPIEKGLKKGAEAK